MINETIEKYLGEKMGAKVGKKFTAYDHVQKDIKGSKNLGQLATARKEMLKWADMYKDSQSYVELRHMYIAKEKELKEK